MEKALILTIPEHIAALPEQEQGPALVQEIHVRKAREGHRMAMMWFDELHQRFAAAQAEEERKREALWNIVDDALLRPLPAPEVASVRWACKSPTAPVYAKGTAGWAMEDMLSRITPDQREYNRKLNAENAAMMASFAEMLGIKKP